MHQFLKFLASVILVLTLLVPLQTQAATFCVDTVAELDQALASFNSAADGSTVTIKLVQGNYPVGNSIGGYYHADNEVGLKLLGGYTAGCADRTINPSNTWIDGLDQGGGGMSFAMDDDANALVEGLTFRHMTGLGADNIMLSIGEVGSGAASRYEVRYCRFVQNSAHYVVDLEGPSMHFVNNLVAQNALSGINASALYAYLAEANDDARLIADNNTIAANTGGFGMRVESGDSSSARASEISDNILWANGSGDLNLVGYNETQFPLLAFFNIYGSVTGYALDSTNFVSDPQFVNAPAQNYAPGPSSPAINSGANLQLLGFPSRDLLGGARIVGSHIDRGAIESAIDDRISFVVTTTNDNGNNTTPTAGSLRAAIKAANAAAGPFVISFAIPGGGQKTLTLAATMLDVVGDVTIDGSTQAGWVANSAFGQFDAMLNLFLYGNGTTPWAFRVPASAANARLVVRGLIFAGFSDAAIRIENGGGHRIEGNQFGAIAFAQPNFNNIVITSNAGGAYIGGFEYPELSNLIAGAADDGIELSNAQGHSAIGNNLIGFQRDGASPGANDWGIHIVNSPGNVVMYNQIGHNSAGGVLISGAGSGSNLLQYNDIGTGLGQGDAAGNGFGLQIAFAAHDTVVGATLASQLGGNLIANSAGAGVWISSTAGAGNRVLANTLVENAGLDIDLNDFGATPNQSVSPQPGPNQLQSYPVLMHAYRGAGAVAVDTISGRLQSTPNKTFRIDVYYADRCADASPARGRAAFWLGRGTATTNAGGIAGIAFTLPTLGLPFGYLSATATDPLGNTSEIGNCLAEEPLVDAIFANAFE